jgi:hypothetical protein
MNNHRPQIDIIQASERTPSHAEQKAAEPISKPARLAGVAYNLVIVETALKNAAAQIATIREQAEQGNYHAAGRSAAALGTLIYNARTHASSIVCTLDALYLWVDGLDQEPK